MNLLYQNKYPAMEQSKTQPKAEMHRNTLILSTNPSIILKEVDEIAS